ncbi:MAG TPA: hypothetical protein VHI54_05805 [Actinomycetota bacterium]|nr:hypothetical protein [Actinomycetota bacterium]
MAEIQIRKTSEDDERLSFSVAIEEAGSRSTHQVTLSRSDHRELGVDTESPEQFVRRCIEWLLEREPKESILARFDVREISQYFPRFSEEIRKRRPQVP